VDAKAILRHPLVEPHVSTVLRSRLVRESGRFAVRELSGAQGEHRYTLRESGLTLLLAHGSPDVLTLDQAYHQHVYEPPPPVADRLAAIGRPIVALDLGANVGLWSLWLHGRFPVARVVALEPDPDNAARQRQVIELNDLGDTWQLIEAAATTRDGSVRFTVGQTTTGHIVTNGESGAATVEGKDVFGLLDELDLLKLDIEGGEWPILADRRFERVDVPVVMLEHHPSQCPSPVPAEAAAEALHGAGYETVSSCQEPNGTGVVWGWRREQV
jgi:FkbM family methyltransferase